jgi:hypothetical protein
MAWASAIYVHTIVGFHSGWSVVLTGFRYQALAFVVRPVSFSQNIFAFAVMEI